jgi:hypothetical protein
MRSLNKLETLIAYRLFLCDLTHYILLLHFTYLLSSILELYLYWFSTVYCLFCIDFSISWTILDFMEIRWWWGGGDFFADNSNLGILMLSAWIYYKNIYLKFQTNLFCYGSFALKFVYEVFICRAMFTVQLHIMVFFERYQAAHILICANLMAEMLHHHEGKKMLKSIKSKTVYTVMSYC